MKVALVGGGGFRTPMVYEALRRAPFARAIDELVLYDVEPTRLDRVAAVLAALDVEQGTPGRIATRTTTDLEDAVAEASFVLCAIRPGGLAARATDERVALDLGVLGQETTGPAGVAFALRTIPAMLDVGGAIAAFAPGAWLLNFTNPAGLVTEALQEVLGERAIGICDSPTSLCLRVSAAMARTPAELRFDYVGLNHFGWLNRVVDAGGRDLLPTLLADETRLSRVDEVRLLGADRIREIGAIPNEYLVYHERAAAIASELRIRSRAEALIEHEAVFYGGKHEDPSEALAAWRIARDLRHATYMAEGWTTSPRSEHVTEGTEGAGSEGYAEVAADVIAALTGTAVERPLILDVANRGAIPWLDDGAVVELPCEIRGGAIAPIAPGPVGGDQRAAIERMKEVERLTIRAARERSGDSALQAIALHPLVPSRDVAERIWAGYVRRHAWIRESFR